MKKRPHTRASSKKLALKREIIGKLASVEAGVRGGTDLWWPLSPIFPPPCNNPVYSA